MIAFADTFYFLALVNPDDDRHEDATAFAKNAGGHIATTAWVMTELADASSAAKLRSLFSVMLRRMQSSPHVTILPPTLAAFTAGVQMYEQHHDKDWSLTDCISFGVMRQRKIKDALTGDRHFDQAGFKALLK
jgi:uncharacterized protein